MREKQERKRGREREREGGGRESVCEREDVSTAMCVCLA